MTAQTITQNSITSVMQLLRLFVAPKVQSMLLTRVTWGRQGGYECSSKGDRRFSALFARMPDGRTVEMHYQCDVKGYQPGGTNWRLGKGKPALDPATNLYSEYLRLWREWSLSHPALVQELAELAKTHKNLLSDMFATSEVNQARALADILNSGQYRAPVGGVRK